MTQVPSNGLCERDTLGNRGSNSSATDAAFMEIPKPDSTMGDAGSHGELCLYFSVVNLETLMHAFLEEDTRRVKQESSPWRRGIGKFTLEVSVWRLHRSTMWRSC